MPFGRTQNTRDRTPGTWNRLDEVGYRLSDEPFHGFDRVWPSHRHCFYYRVQYPLKYKMLTGIDPAAILFNYPISTEADRRAVRYWSILVPNARQELENSCVLEDCYPEYLAVKEFLFLSYEERIGKEVKANQKWYESTICYKIEHVSNCINAILHKTPERQTLVHIAMATSVMVLAFFKLPLEIGKPYLAIGFVANLYFFNQLRKIVCQ
jgi:hypothetical protein